jgi:hypothetical protein
MSGMSARMRLERSHVNRREEKERRAIGPACAKPSPRCPPYCQQLHLRRRTRSSRRSSSRHRRRCLCPSLPTCLSKRTFVHILSCIRLCSRACSNHPRTFDFRFVALRFPHQQGGGLSIQRIGRVGVSE